MTSIESGSSLARVARGDLCAGCGACVALAPSKISMTETAPGYLRPLQSAPLNAAEDAAIARVCPGLGQGVEAQGRNDPPLWGPYITMMTGHATDPAIRHTGASGGGLSAILISLLDGDTVDAVVHVAADPDRPIGNATVLSMAQDDVVKAAGSRYAPSAPLADLDMRLAEHEATGRRFAFVGKPCDAAALSAMRGQDPQVASAFPVILSFFCAGVPSFTGVRALLTALGTDETQTAQFRYRGNGWPGQASAVNHDGQNRSMSYHESWGNILSRHVQHRCKICADGTGVAADIVCADAWESDAAGYPVFTEGDGTSLIVARTPLGADLVNAARAGAWIETKPFDVTALAAIQPGQRNRRRALLARLAALKLAGHPIPRYRGLHLIAAARQNTMKSNLKNFAGMLQRVMLSKIKRAHR